MQIEEASKILAQMYNNAERKEVALSVHLFGIKYADQIGNMSANDIAIGAGIKKSYGTEIRKGMRLAKYVELK